MVCAPPKAKHHFKMPKMSFGHKKAAATCATYAPASYAAPTYATPQSYTSPQASHQGM